MTDHEKAALIHYLLCRCDMFAGRISDMSVKDIEYAWYPEFLDKLIILGKDSCKAHHRRIKQ